MPGDLEGMRHICAGRFRITLLEERSFSFFLTFLRRRKISIAGFLLMLAVFYGQSLFVTEIRIDGYRAIPEESIRQTLRSAGVYEGAPKLDSLRNVENVIYGTYDRVAWVSVKYSGKLCSVRLAETGSAPPRQVESRKPCNIVAARSGYIYDIKPYRGRRLVKDGSFVNKGQVIISGRIKYSSTTFDSEGEKIYRVHARGDVLAKVPRRFTFYLSANDRELIRQKGTRYGISVSFGEKDFDALSLKRGYRCGKYSSRDLINSTKYIPLRVSLEKIEKMSMKTYLAGKDELRKRAEWVLRQQIKEKLPENVQILKKSLKFEREKNIIKVSAIVETLQDIGKEQEIEFGKSESDSKSGDNNN